MRTNRAHIELRGSAQSNAERIPSWVGVLEAVDDERCTMTIGAASREALISHLILTGVEFKLIGPPELAAGLREAAARLERAVSG